MPTTLRIELESCEFDWKEGVILFQPTNPRTRTGSGTRVLSQNDPQLDTRISNGSTFCDFPRVVAFDKKGVIVIYKDEQQTGMERIRTKPSAYLDDPDYPLPYPDD